MRLFGGPEARTRKPRLYRPTLQASAQRVDRADADRLRRLAQPWQQRALAFYDTVGECWYPAQGYARALERIRFFPGTLNERGEIEEADDGPLVDLFDRIQDPGGGRQQLQGSYGRLDFLIGDGYLTVTEDGESEAWEYLSPAELRIVPGSDPVEYLRYRAPGIQPEELMDAPDDAFTVMEGDARVWRLWRRHPTYSEWADSPVKGVLELYDLLQWLTLAASAQSANRAANRGIFFLPDELDYGQNDVAEPDEDPQNDPLIQEIIEGQQRAIRNPGTAEAASPWFLRAKGLLPHPDGAGASHMKDLMGWLPMGPEDRYAEAEMWEKTLDRIANGLDSPVDWVTGRTGDSNHWSGWLVDEQGFRLHIAPIAERFARDLNAAYLRPAAVDAGVPDAERTMIGFDAAAAINHPDEIKTAFEALRNGAVGFAYARDKMGATDDDAPTEDELRLVFALQKATFPGDEPEETETPPQEGGMGGDVNEQPPSANGNSPADQVSASALKAAHVLGALDFTIHRARELAGNRLITKAQGCRECRERIAAVTAPEVAWSLGSDQVREILAGRGDEASLVAGAADGLAASISKWVTADAAIELGRLAEQHVARTLYEQHPPPLPIGVHAVIAKGVR